MAEAAAEAVRKRLAVEVTKAATARSAAETLRAEAVAESTQLRVRSEHVSAREQEAEDGFAAKAEAAAAWRDNERTREVMAVMLDNMTLGVAMFDRDTKLAARNTFLVDPEGKIVKEFIGVQPGGHSEEVLAALGGLQKH